MEEIFAQLDSFTPALVLGLGLAIGLQHAFEPDHLAAMTTQIAKQKNQRKTILGTITKNFSKSGLLGAIWGAGHTTTLALVGLLVFVLALNIPQTIFLGFEFIVGLMLIGLGISTLKKKKLVKQHIHPHEHENGTIHTHPHEHNGDHKHTHKSYLIGCLHGLAGGGALIVLAASTFESFEEILSFIFIFGIGSIFGMTLVSGLIGLPFALTSKISATNQILKYLASGIGIIIGTTIIYQVGILENLFGL